MQATRNFIIGKYVNENWKKTKKKSAKSEGYKIFLNQQKISKPFLGGKKNQQQVCLPFLLVFFSVLAAHFFNSALRKRIKIASIPLRAGPWNTHEHCVCGCFLCPENVVQMWSRRHVYCISWKNVRKAAYLPAFWDLHQGHWKIRY